MISNGPAAGLLRIEKECVFRSENLRREFAGMVERAGERPGRAWGPPATSRHMRSNTIDSRAPDIGARKSAS
jgi:hypothetical protein